MAYDERLAERVRRALTQRGVIAEERKMFGGIAFMVGGHMVVGIVKDELMVRIGPKAYADALAWPHTRPMDFTGRAMKGMVFVAPPGVARAAQIGHWLEKALEYAATLPAKVNPAL